MPIPSPSILVPCTVRLQVKREVDELKAVRRQLEDNIGQLELDLTKKDGNTIPNTSWVIEWYSSMQLKD